MMAVTEVTIVSFKNLNRAIKNMEQTFASKRIENEACFRKGLI